MRKKYVITEKQLKNLYNKFEKNEDHPLGTDYDSNAPWNETSLLEPIKSRHKLLTSVNYDNNQYLYMDKDKNYIYYFDSDNNIIKSLYEMGYLEKADENWSTDMIYNYDNYDVFEGLYNYLNDFLHNNPNVFKESNIDDFFNGTNDYIYITPETPSDVIDEIVDSYKIKRSIKFS